MAAVTWFMHIRRMDDLVGEVSSTNDWPNPAPEMVIRSATFSSNAGDSPDVVTSRGQPDIGGILTEELAYTPPPSSMYEAVKPTLTGTTTVGDHEEFTADGTASFTLTLDKVDSRTDNALGLGTESFMLCILGGDIRPSASKFSLVSGQGVVTFTPPSTMKGAVSISIMNVDHALLLKEKVKTILIL